jgi:hypothetical protein
MPQMPIDRSMRFVGCAAKREKKILQRRMGEAAHFVGALMIQVKQRNKWKATGSPSRRN